MSKDCSFLLQHPHLFREQLRIACKWITFGWTDI